MGGWWSRSGRWIAQNVVYTMERREAVGGRRRRRRRRREGAMRDLVLAMTIV
jgi:hypothetical protein